MCRINKTTTNINSNILYTGSNICQAALSHINLTKHSHRHIQLRHPSAYEVMAITITS